MAWRDLPAKRRTLAGLKVEVESDWIIWRNYQIEQWEVEILPYVKLRPVIDYYFDAEIGDACLAWINAHGFYMWEIPAYDGEDDDFVYDFIAHWLAVMAWLAFEPLWDHLDYTEAEIEEFFNLKMNYAPRPKKKAQVGQAYNYQCSRRNTMQFPKIIFMLSSKQAWFLYFLLRVVPGGTAKELRTNLGNLLEAMKLPQGK